MLITGVLDEAVPDSGVPSEEPEPARVAHELRAAPPAAEDTDEFGSFLKAQDTEVASILKQLGLA